MFPVTTSSFAAISVAAIITSGRRWASRTFEIGLDSSSKESRDLHDR
jgi:hypothetical protein